MTTITMKEVAAFLLGEASLDGYWFGERHPISPFWWREHLRASQPATAPEQKLETTGVIDGHWYLDAANAGELAAYDYACQESLNAVTYVLNGNDDGHGIANLPWEPVRRRLLKLIATASAQPAWQDAPTVPGTWILSLDSGMEVQENITQHEIDIEATWPGGRWFGPLPEDKP